MFSRRLFRAVLVLILSTSVLVGCATAPSESNPSIEAIQDIRSKLGLPDLPVEFVEPTSMVNSPHGNLSVALYTDSAGRKYYVEPETQQVVEIDARAILASIASDKSALSSDELREKAKAMLTATLPDFEASEAGLVYEEGDKGENYFFTWRNEAQMGIMNYPFVQVGLHVSGELFAYYNTLSLK